MSNISCQIHLNNSSAPAVTDRNCRWDGSSCSPEMAHVEIHLTSGVKSGCSRAGTVSSVCEQRMELMLYRRGMILKTSSKKKLDAPPPTHFLLLPWLFRNFFKSADRLFENRVVTVNSFLHPSCWVCWEPSLITYADAPNRWPWIYQDSFRSPHTPKKKHIITIENLLWNRQISLFICP